MAFWTIKQGKSAINKLLGDVEKFFGFKPKNAPERKYMKWSGDEPPQKIMKAVIASYKRMQPLRSASQKAVKQFVGRIPGYENSAPRDVPVNKIYQMVRVYMRLLAPENPQALVTTNYPELRPFAETLRVKLNNHLREINIADTLTRAILDGMFGYGIVKSGLAEGTSTDMLDDGSEVDAGEPLSAYVPLKIFVIDMTAENVSDISFIGDRYKRPLIWAKQLLGENVDSDTSQIMRGEQRISQDTESESDEELYKNVWFWDIYLPKQKKMLIFQDGKETPLVAYDWDGPDIGPYQILVFDWTPNEIMPVSPVQNLLPLHNFINGLLRKLERQANRQKTLTIVDRSADEDAQTVRDAGDGDIVGLINGPDAVGEQKFGGPDPVNHNLSIWSIQQFDDHAGGIPVLAGTQPMSETFKQDQLLHSSANVLIDAMRQKIMTFINKIIYTHAWYIWTDPIREINVIKKIPGTNIEVPVTVPPDVRDGDFLQYNFSIDPYSLQNRTPNERAQQIIALWNQIIMPSAGLIQQAGYMPNVREVMKQLCELQGIPFSDLFIPMDLTAAKNVEQPGKVPLPESMARIYRSETVNTRVSRPGTTQAGNVNKIVAANMAFAKQGA